MDKKLFYADVKHCARCGDDHTHVLFTQITNPIECEFNGRKAIMEYFAMCPMLNEPLMTEVFIVK